MDDSNNKIGSKIICAAVAHSDGTIDLTVYKSRVQSITIRQSDVPFVIAALNDALRHQNR